MRHKKFDFRLMGIALIAVVAFIVIEIYNVELDMPTGMGQTLIALFPGIVVVLMGIYGHKHSRSGIGHGASLIGVGIGLAYFIGSADTQGLVTAEMLSGLTVAQLQTWVVALSVFGGGIIAAYHR